MVRILYIYIFICFLMLSAFSVQAKHIIGGEILYRCNGGGNYSFEMNIYRDCRPQQNAAEYDPRAVVSIYRENPGGIFVFVTSLRVAVENIGDVEAPEYPCLILPPNLCVEKGTYNFNYQIPDWPSTDSYHIVYQRCCRNNTISNIFTPGDIGATYSTEITPAGQEVCNSSPRFNSFPPTVVCVNSPLRYDHGAVDTDGDSLVYEFCFPFKGGGKGGASAFSGDPSACDGVKPDPACPPPFKRVAFRSPLYQYDAPMGGDPIVKIDSATGIFSGKPTTKGQFVIGVCVKEYKDGTLIGELRRDFQFNVADCDPTVFAKIKSDAKIGDKDFIVNSCGDNTIPFVNESERLEFINSYRWEFDIRGTTETFTTKDVEVTFPGIGEYRGLMMVNPGTDCGDTADIYVNLYPDINADFSFEYDTCIAGPVQFKDLSTTGSERMVGWEWDFAGHGISNQVNPSFEFTVPGYMAVQIQVTDVNECVDTAIKTIPYFPIPPLVVVQPDRFVGCQPAVISFTNLSTPIDSSYDVIWQFGDGGSVNKLSPDHVYEDIGVYDVSLEITSPLGCFTRADFPRLIRVQPSPVADFSFFPKEPSNFNPTVNFVNESSRAESIAWLFGRQGRSTVENPTYTFPDTGVYTIDLIAIHENGCTDTASAVVDVVPRVTYHMPNAFTPNTDGKNDGFRGVGFTEGMRAFQLTIWNRWGELIFQTSDPAEEWNGRKNSTGDILPNGVYVYVVQYLNPRGEKVELNGVATLIR